MSGLLALASWLFAWHAAATPAWEAPDEPWHLVYAERLAAGRMPTRDDTYQYHHPPGAYLWLALAQRTLGWGPLPLAPDEARFPLSPNAYLHEAAQAPTEARLRLLRVMGSLLVLPALALLVAAARLAGLSRQAATLVLLAALLPPVVPATLATVNNDGAAFVAGTLLLYAALRLRAASEARRPGAAAVDVLALALALMLAALSKLSVWSLLPIPIAAALWPIDGHGPWWRRLAWRQVAVVLAAAALALALLILAADHPLLSGLRRIPQQILSRGDAGSLWQPDLAQDAWRIIGSAVGVYGWQNLHLHLGLRLSVLAALLLAAVVGCLARRRTESRRDRWAGGMTGLLLAAVMLQFASVLANGAGDPAALQGRLLLPALAAWALLAGRGLARIASAGWRGWLWALGLILSPFAAQLTALLLLLPLGRGQGGRPPGILLRRTVQVLQPDLLLRPGSPHQETLSLERPAYLEQLEAPVLVGKGRGSLRLDVTVQAAGAASPSAFSTSAPLLALGRRAINAQPRIGPLADSSWLALRFDPPLDLPAGSQLQVRVTVDPPSAADQDTHGAPDRAADFVEDESQALLWTADLAPVEREPSANLRLRQAEADGDPAPPIAWIAYGIVQQAQP